MYIPFVYPVSQSSETSTDKKNRTESAFTSSKWHRKLASFSLLAVLLCGASLSHAQSFSIANFSTAPTLAATQTPGAWYTDRYAPNGFTSQLLGGDNRLVIQIRPADAAPARLPAFSSNFYNTQGRKYDMANGVTVITGDQFIPANWLTTNRRSEIWAGAVDNSNANSAYGIIGFANINGSTPTIRYWTNVAPNGAWVNTGVAIIPNTFYTYRIVLSNDSIRYYVNNSFVGADATYGSVRFNEIIMQAFNFGDPAIPVTSGTYDPGNSYDAIWDNVGGLSRIKNQTQNVYESTIQSAINNANPGDSITLANGTYTQSTQLQVTKGVKLQGESQSGVILDVSGNSTGGWAIHLAADNITMRNMTVIPVAPASVPTPAFTFHAPAENPTVTLINNLWLENITVNGARRTPFDIHGVNNATLINLTANNTTNGNGIQFSGVNGGSVDGFTGNNNAWGAIAFYTSGPAIFNRGTTNVTVNGATFNSNGNIYSENTAILTNSGNSVTGWDYYVKNSGHRANGHLFTFFSDDLTTATALGLALQSAPLIVNTTSALQNKNTGNWEVVPALTINAAINAATAGNTVFLHPGTFNEDVALNKQLTLSGSGIDVSTVMGPIGGAGSGITVTANNAIVENMTITRAGNNTTDWDNPNLNSAGIAIQGQSITGTEIRNSKLIGNRTGIDINNSNGHNIHNNIINNNRTGLIFRNQTDNISFTENEVTDNWTVGVLFLDASGGSNSPVQTAANGSFNNNNISGNWYGQVVDRQAGGSLLPVGTNLKGFSCNWYGTITPVVTTANSTEPGYSAQIPVIYGGSATNPGGAPDIAGAASANIVYGAFLTDGTDDNGGEIGFQPVAGSCNGCNGGGLVTNTNTGIVYCTIQSAVSAASAGNTLSVGAGTFTEQVEINKNITINGAGTGVTNIVSPATLAIGFTGGFPCNAVVYAHDAANVQISGVTVDGAGTGSVNNRLAAIAFNNAGGSVSDCETKGTRHNPLNGVQGGYGIVAYAGTGTNRTVSISDNAISDYQKNGVDCRGANLTANVSGNTITGAGPTALIAQNGAVLGFGAGGSVTGNTVSGNDYTGINASSTGILIYQSGSSNVSVSENAVNACQYGVATVDAPSTTITQNVIAGAGNEEGIDIYNLGAVTGTTTIANNSISGVDLGMWFGADAGSIAAEVHENSILGISAIVNDNNTATVDASCNWYGSNDGIDISAMISGDVSYSPWLNDGTDDAPATTGFQAVAGACVETSNLVSSDCGNINLLPNATITAESIIPATKYTFEFLTTLDVPIGAVERGTNTLGLGSALVANAGITITPGTQYHVRVKVKVAGVYGGYGQICTIGIASNNTSLQAADCGKIDFYKADVVTATTVTGANQYKFKFTRATTPFDIKEVTVNTYILSLSNGTLNNGFAVNPGDTFNVEVQAKVAGSFGPYGSSCGIRLATIASPTVAECGSTVVKPLTINSGVLEFHASLIPGATQYEFVFTNEKPESVKILTASRVLPISFTNTLYQFIVQGQTYSLQVRAKVSNTWGAYSSSCTFDVQGTQLTACPLLDIQPSGSIAAQNVTGADEYTFNFYDAPSGGVLLAFVTKPAPTMKINDASLVALLGHIPAPNDSFWVEVTNVKKGILGVAGNRCKVTIIKPELDVPSCGANVPADQRISSILVSGSSKYRYHFTLVGGTPADTAVATITYVNTTKQSVSLSHDSIQSFINSGSEYMVKVQTFGLWGWSAYGPSCEIEVTDSIGPRMAFEEQATNDVVLYPNPTTGTLNIELSLNGEARLVIQDVTGRTMVQKSISGNGNTSQSSVDVSNFAAGSYMLNIITNDGKIYHKQFVKK